MAYVIGEDCISCGTCAGECPVEAISEGAERYVIDADACTECGTCASVCPSEAIKLPKAFRTYKKTNPQPIHSVGDFSF